MHAKSTASSALQPAVFYPIAYDAVQQGATRASSPTSSSSTSPRASMGSRRDSCQNSTGSHETKRTYKTGFLTPAQTAQFDFLVERFKHRKQASKEREGLTAANLKALEMSQS